MIKFRLHKNFYRPELTKAEIQPLKKNIEFFASEFLEINYVDVGQALQPYIEGKLTTAADLEGIIFTQYSQKEKIGAKIYEAKYRAI